MDEHDWENHGYKRTCKTCGMRQTMVVNRLTKKLGWKTTYRG